jgi:steroid 5-alpha reductase family enzyme
VWLIKDLCFPDAGWQKKITIGAGLVAFFGVLFWYWVMAWLLISAPQTPDYPLADEIWFALCISMCVIGCVVMIAADAQKYYTLKYHKGLIVDGIHKYIRHPNYLGEIMIYGSFGLLVWHWGAAVILLTVWLLVFLPNMVAKENSLSRYPEWQAYKKSSGWLLPFL